MFLRFSIVGVLLTATLMFTYGDFGAPITSENASAAIDDKALHFANPIIEHENTKVQILEVTRAFSPSHNHTVTSVLFMIEHLGDAQIESLANRSPLNFSDDKGETIALSVADCPKTGAATHDFQRFNPPWHIEMPKPANPSRTYIVRQWFCHDIPDNAAAINAAFGSNNELKEFRFILNRR